MPSYVERTAGIYRATYQGCRDVEFTNAETHEIESRWAWTFQEKADSSTVGEISKLTPRSLKSPNSNAHKMAAGIMGRKLQPGDDTETMVGREYDVVYGPNQAGNLTITSVVLVQEAGQTPAAAPVTAEQAPTPEPAPVAATVPSGGAQTIVEDDLPF